MPADKGMSWFWNRKLLSAVCQCIALALTGGGLYLLFSNAVRNMAERGVKPGAWFLETEASFKIGFSPFWPYELGVTKYWEVFVIGIQNTVLVSFLGIVSASFLGLLIGVMRFSDNWFVSKFAAFYIELFRNIPLLLQIFFWYFIVILGILPHRRDSLVLADSLFINKEGLYFPKPMFESWHSIAAIGFGLVISFIVVALLKRWARQRQEETGRRFPTFLASLGIVCGLLSLSYLAASGSVAVELPELSKLRVRGGFWVPVPLLALWFSLTTYTAAFIGENVRGGIQSIPRGQMEAASALGLHNRLALRLILIPQAMRVIVPPTISQYLNLTKNSSLAVAIGYDELVNIWMGISLNQTGQALIIIAMTMLVYTTLSLATSGLMNLYNTRTQLLER